MSEVKPGQIYSTAVSGREYMVLSIRNELTVCIPITDAGFLPWNIETVAVSRIAREWEFESYNPSLLSDSIGIENGSVKLNSASKLKEEIETLKKNEVESMFTEHNLKANNAKFLDVIAVLTEVIKSYE